MSVDVEPVAEAAMEGAGEPEAGGGESVRGPAPVVNRALIAQLVGDAQRQGLAIDGEGGLLAQLSKLVVESALEGELTAHLGYEKHERTEEPPGNRPQRDPDQDGPDQGRTRPDRLEPMAVAKRQRRLGSIEDIVLSLSARGMTHGDICATATGPGRSPSPHSYAQ